MLPVGPPTVGPPSPPWSQKTFQQRSQKLSTASFPDSRSIISFPSLTVQNNCTTDVGLDQRPQQLESLSRSDFVDDGENAEFRRHESKRMHRKRRSSERREDDAKREKISGMLL